MYEIKSVFVSLSVLASIGLSASVFSQNSEKPIFTEIRKVIADTRMEPIPDDGFFDRKNTVAKFEESEVGKLFKDKSTEPALLNAEGDTVLTMLLKAPNLLKVKAVAPRVILRQEDVQEKYSLSALTLRGMAYSPKLYDISVPGKRKAAKIAMVEASRRYEDAQALYSQTLEQINHQLTLSQDTKFKLIAEARAYRNLQNVFSMIVGSFAKAYRDANSEDSLKKIEAFIREDSKNRRLIRPPSAFPKRGDHD